MTDFSLDFICPVCGAQPKEKCTLTTGAARFESHVERKWIAQDHHRKLTKPRPAAQRQDSTSLRGSRDGLKPIPASPRWFCGQSTAPFRLRSGAFEAVPW